MGEKEVGAGGMLRASTKSGDNLEMQMPTAQCGPTPGL